AGFPVLGPRRAVDHHRQIHVVEVTEAKELGLAAEELELPRARLAHPPLDVAVLLRGHREEHEAAREVLRSLRLDEAHGGTEEARDLRVVAARMRGARRRIGFGMA